MCGALDNRRDAKRAPKVAAQADLQEMAADRVPARGCAGQLICRYNLKKLSITPPPSPRLRGAVREVIGSGAGIDLKTSGTL